MPTSNTVPNGDWLAEQIIVQRRARFKSCVVANKGAAGFWLWVCDSKTPASRPSMCPIFVPANTTQSIDRSESPRAMMEGIYVCATTDPLTKTLIPAGDAYFEVDYENV